VAPAALEPLVVLACWGRITIDEQEQLAAEGVAVEAGLHQAVQPVVVFP
jgi:hypothetical protein